MDENLRFIMLLDSLKSAGIIKDYVQIASVLETNKAGISDIKNGRKKLSIDLLRRMKLSYPTVNLEWVIMGTGEPFLKEKSKEDETLTPSLISTYLEKIASQAEEIGALKERLRAHEIPKNSSSTVVSQLETETATLSST